MKKKLTGIVILLYTIILLFSATSVSADTKFGHLAGVNWFGFETANLCPHGLWSRDYKSMLKQIHDLGFNCIRLPWCNAALTGSPSSIQINAYGVDAYTNITGMNLDLDGLTSIQIMDKIIDEAASEGIYIILDNHSHAPDGYMNETLWYTSACPESQWISDWTTLVTRYLSKSNVIGCDLKNEPHGTTTSGMKPPASWGYDVAGYGITNWQAAAQRCGAAILKVNSNLLIIVEGVEEYPTGEGYWWGGNLRGVKDYPITGIPAGNLVYSAHEYGSSVFNQTWFSDPTFPANMAAIWDDHFYFIQKQGIAPLFFGEFGITDAAAADSTSVDYKWFTTFMAYVGKSCSWTMWCWNPNSGDTGGMLENDWVTVDQAKYNLVKPYLAGSTGPTPTAVPTAPPVVTAAPTAAPTIVPTAVPTTAPTTAPGGLLGDVNGSGSIDIVDALLVAQYYVGLNPAGFVTANADVTKDGSIDIVDALRIAQYYVGLIAGF
jgi:endoglucanase